MKFAKYILLGILLTGCGHATVEVVDTMGSLVFQQPKQKPVCTCRYETGKGPWNFVCRDENLKEHPEVNCVTGEVRDAGTK